MIPNRLADVLVRKEEGRRELAARPISEKLAILDEIRSSLEPIQRARIARDASEASKSEPPSGSIRR